MEKALSLQSFRDASFCTRKILDIVSDKRARSPSLPYRNPTLMALRACLTV